MTDYQLDERSFLNLLEDGMAQTGDLGDLFPRMVAYNVPLYVLTSYWPAERDRLIGTTEFPAFCVAEAGWKGRIENLQGHLDAAQRRVVFEKTYVMQCDVIYALLRAGDGLAICRVPASKSQEWRSRGEDAGRFVSRQGVVRDHFIVRTDEVLEPDSFVLIRKRSYVAAGVAIPRREITGLAMLALGYMRFLGEDTTYLQSLREQILQAREHGRLDGEAVSAAGEIYNQLLRVLPGNAHALWSRAGQIFFKS